MSELANPERERRGETTTPPAVSDAHPVADAPGSPRRWLARLAALVVLLGVIGFAVWFFALRGPSNDLERFQGEWKLTLATQAAKNDEDAPAVVAVRVEGDRWTYLAGISERAYRLALHETANQKELDLDLIDTEGIAGRPVKMHGIYSFDGNRKVKVRLEPAMNPRPRTLDDSEAVVWILTRVKLKPQVPPR